jgi:hypothetical protein
VIDVHSARHGKGEDDNNNSDLIRKALNRWDHEESDCSKKSGVDVMITIFCDF